VLTEIAHDINVYIPNKITWYEFETLNNSDRNE